jgi:DNA-binding response OmpR family regulator
MSIRKTILVADDDRLMRKILRSILSRAGYEVLLAEDGERAVEIAASERPDLVLSDGMLPKLHGFEVCKAIKHFDVAPAVFLLTGSSTKSADKARIMGDSGADAVFDKPVDYDELLECISRQLSLPGLMPLGEPQPIASYAS